MKKLDRRVVRTRRSLKAALIELILELGYDRISIRILTERADTGYATFYRHYKTVDELMTQILLDLIAELESRLQPGMSIYDEALTLYRFVLERQDIYYAAFKLPRSCPAVKTAWDRIREVARERYVARPDCGFPFDASVNHLIASVWELTRWWLKEGSCYSPEEIASIHTELIVKAAEQVALDPLDKPYAVSAIS